MRIVKILGVLLVLLSFSACQNEKEDYDKAPDWLKGNAFQLLKSKGNFSCFLRGVELSAFHRLVDGGGLCTVFAPDDEAFDSWLKNNNYQSIDEAWQKDPKRMELLIAFHLVEQSFNRNQLLNFQMNQSSGNAVNQGDAYKYKTFAKEEPREQFDPQTNRVVKVYQREKYLPVISSRLYTTRDCSNPEWTHKYFFPDVNWQGVDDQLYVADAAVKENGIPVDNGYVYTLDKVVEPRRTVYDAVNNPHSESANFSIFLELFDRFENFVYDKTISDKYALPGEKYYLRYHNASPRAADDLPELDSEWGYHGEQDNARPSYVRYLSEGTNCFAFTNEVFEAFFQKYFSGFDSYKDIPEMTLYYLLMSHSLDHQKIKLPDDIQREGVKGQLGEYWMIDTTNIVYREFCANGIVYGVDSIFVPAVYDIVTRPLFLESNYSIMANMFYKANEFVTLVSREKDLYTLFLPNDDLLSNKYQMRVNYKNPIFGDEVVEYTKDQSWVAYKDAEISTYVQHHVIYGAIRDFVTPKYYATKLPFTYIFVKDNVIHTENRGTINLVSETPIETLNGVAYEIDDLFDKSTENLSSALQQPEYMRFFQKLRQAGLTESYEENKEKKDRLNFLQGGDNYMVFVPSDAFLEKLPNPVTQNDTLKLRNYLKYSFISMAENRLMDYILPNFNQENTSPIYTLEEKETSTPIKKIYREVFVRFNGAESLKIIDDKQNELVTTEDIPRFVKDGMIYKLQGGFGFE